MPDVGDRIRRVVLDQSRRADVGHVGSCLSVADIVGVLYGDVLRVDTPEDPDRDRFVMSKGHAALTLYAALSLRGWITPEELDRFCGDDTHLGVHAEFEVPGVDVSTGSLGQGLSLGGGLALGARLRGDSWRTFVLLSDAECNEGSMWEAVMFASHHGLTNLVAVVDMNGQQALGYTDDVLAMPDMGRRWEAFGWEVVEVDGHSRQELVDALDVDPDQGGRPRVVLARTVFGKGVSYMESRIEWHYLPMSEEQYRLALQEIGASP